MVRISKPKHTFVPFPKGRLASIDFIADARRQDTIYALVEYDVTKPRQLMLAHRENTNEALSFTSFIVRCVAKAVDDDKEMAAYRKADKGMIIFDDVDVSTLIERDFGGRKHPTLHFVTSANKKSFRDIHEDILRARSAPIDEAMLTETRRTRFLSLPRFIRKLMLRTMRRNPFVKKFATGTVGVTTLGMFVSDGAGRRVWPLPISPWTLMVAVGPFYKAPAVVDDEIVIRELLSLTICFDHDIIDGGPAARFVRRLGRLIEGGFELPGGPTEV